MTDKSKLDFTGAHDDRDQSPNSRGCGVNFTGGHKVEHCGGGKASFYGTVTLTREELRGRLASKPEVDEHVNCEFCAGTGTAGHPDSGYACIFCEGAGATQAPVASVDGEFLDEIRRTRTQVMLKYYCQHDARLATPLANANPELGRLLGMVGDLIDKLKPQPPQAKGE